MLSVTSSVSTTDTGFTSEVGTELDVCQMGVDLLSTLDREKINKEASAADQQLEDASDMKDASSTSDLSTTESDISLVEKDDYSSLTTHRRTLSDPLNVHHQGDVLTKHLNDDDSSVAVSIPKKYSLGLDLDRKYSQRSTKELENELSLNQGEDEDVAFRTESISSQDVRAHLERSFQVEAVACKGVPLIHCVRLMCSFLLSGHPGQVLPDASVRVSVKSLALSCTARALRLCPEAFFVKVLPDEEIETKSDASQVQLVRDILLYSSHPDPQLRGSLSLVVGNLIKAALIKARYVNCISYNLDKLCRNTK